MNTQGDIALIGLAVMGQNLILNMNDHGFTVVAYNRTVSKVDEFLAKEAKGTKVIGASSIPDMVAKLKKPRRVMMLVKAGPAVDDLIQQLVPHLEPGDIIIDGGNSLAQDTARRVREVEAKGLLYVGTGVSGGEEGARRGPSIMPGGSPAAWPHLRPIFQGVAAKVEGGAPCCDWVGEGGAGHYVKMVHNGIEYGDMQLIGEAYHLMKEGLGMSYDEMHEVFAEWNQGVLDSYLIEITRDILAFKEPDGTPLVERILDTAGQKGTGKWTVQDSMEHGIPITLISEAVYARFVSALKDERVAASKVLEGPTIPRIEVAGDAGKRAMIDAIRDALYASKMISYAQGYMLMRAAAKANGWNLNYGGIALMWRGGGPNPRPLLRQNKGGLPPGPPPREPPPHPCLQGGDERAHPRGGEARARPGTRGGPPPPRSAPPALYDSYRSARLPANLLQAQRDYFGAHTYERTDGPRGEFHHTNWTGRGGETSSSTYNA